MKRLAIAIIALLMVVAFTLPASAQLNARGKLTLLRVHDVGTGFGPPTDFIDVEVVIAVDSQPGKFFGFQLRNDAQQAARQGMLELLRTAFERDFFVNFDFMPVPGKKNSLIIRVWLSK